MSLALCTATSMALSSSASSISLTNSRLVPTSDIGADCSRSPVVLMMTSSTSTPADSSRAATVRACHSASWLPRVPMRSNACISRGGSAIRALVAAPRRTVPRRRARTGGSRRPNRPRSGVSSRTAFNCSVGVSSSFWTRSCVISSTRARASGGRPASFGSSRASSDCRIASKRSRSATTVGMTSRECSHALNFATSSPTIASARSSSLDRRVRFSLTMPWRSSML